MHPATAELVTETHSGAKPIKHDEGSWPGAQSPKPGCASSSSDRRRPTAHLSRTQSLVDGGYQLPEDLSNVEDAQVNSPLESPAEPRRSVPAARLGTPSSQPNREPDPAGPPGTPGRPPVTTISGPLAELYTISYLGFFAILGTLARLGLQALTTYPGTPTIFSSLWPNFAGCLVMGFLAEDRKLFLHEWGILRSSGGESRKDSDHPAAILAARKAHLAVKKTIPLYIGLATGFCGSFTSFSSFMRDVFLALSNDLPPPGEPQSTTIPRNGGYSFMALLAVLIVTISLSLSGLSMGAHLAIAIGSYTPSISFRVMSKVLDRTAVILAFGCWLGAVLLTALPPHNDEYWRGTATFALVFAPLGCLLRFYISAWLNKRRASFPWGTFAVNILGTAVLGMAWDIQHVPVGGVLGCQALQGIEDGFCGCLTTVSTWAAELVSLRRRDAYVYGAASVGAGLAVMVAVIGGLRWTEGFATIQCVH